MKIRAKKVNIFQDIALKNFNSIENIFFDLQKFYILLMPANVAGLLKNSFIWIGRISYTYKKIILKGTEFRGGSDEKMLWLAFLPSFNPC